VAVLEGCVQPELLPRVGHATVDSLAKLGVASVVPRTPVCCGSLHAHNGDREGARRLARRFIESFEGLRDADGRELEIVMNSAGCGAHLRELAHLFDRGDEMHERAQALSKRVVDYSEITARLLEEDSRTLDLASLPSPITWDDPCHLCHGQGVRSEPRAVLSRARGAEVVPLPDSESCCGSAGIYSFLRPADSDLVFARKLDAFRASGARTLVTANPGCQIQWESGLRRAGVEARVVHLAELVDLGLG
jgi:glycolate oxidase iron-sulfur subunit